MDSEKIHESRVAFQSYDGLELVGTFVAPDGICQHAALLTHGLPSSRDEYGFYSDMAAALARRSVASLRFDFRYCGESSPGKFSDLTPTDMMNDIEAARVELARLSGLDQFSLISTSASGGVGILWSRVTPTSPSYVFLMAPVLDYWQEVTGRAARTAFPALSDVESRLLRDEGSLGHGERYGREFVGQVRALPLAALELTGTSPGGAIFHGTSDGVVPFAASVEFSKAHPQFELVEIDGADHGFAVNGDDDLVFPGTKANHRRVYELILERLGF